MKSAPPVPDVDGSVLEQLDWQQACGFADMKMYLGRILQVVPCEQAAAWWLRITFACGSVEGAVVCDRHHDLACSPATPLACQACSGLDDVRNVEAGKL